MSQQQKCLRENLAINHMPQRPQITNVGSHGIES